MKNFVRLPNTTDRSLKAWSAVDEHILKHLEEENYSIEQPYILHDRFGYLTYQLSVYGPTTITYLDSQKQSIITNAKVNSIDEEAFTLLDILDTIPVNGNLAMMKVPKSLDLFRLYLIKLSEILAPDGVVIAGFMTRHFSKAMLSIASDYFEEVEQSKAWKKSRLLILSQPKKEKIDQVQILNQITYKDFEYKQYLGVFSANHIDYATQFLLENLELRKNESSFLDIGCGNGVIGKHLLDLRSWEYAVLMDDSTLATASTAMNIANHKTVSVVCKYNFDSFQYDQFDLVITNPPFHFEYEVDPSIAIQMMQDTQRILSPNGRLVIVANRHLNYKSQLSKWYQRIDIMADNDKFVIYEAYKSSNPSLSN